MSVSEVRKSKPLKLQLQSIICQLHVRWECRVGGLVAEFVRDVGEVGTPRLDAFHHGQGLRQGKVRGVGIRTQAVEDQRIQPLEQREGWTQGFR